MTAGMPVQDEKDAKSASSGLRINVVVLSLAFILLLAILVVAAILMIGVIGLILDVAFRRLEKLRTVRWGFRLES